MEQIDRTGSIRIVSIDRMRGFSLLGIFLVNMISFHSPLFYIDPETWWGGTLNRVTYVFIDIFVQASFYPLFAMLFGYGLVILEKRIRQRKLRFYPIVIRRLFILLLIGILHAFLVWHGDILITYAVSGFIFLLFISWNAKRLLFTGVIIYIVPNLLLLFMLGASTLHNGGDQFSMYDKEAAEQAIIAYHTGSFAEVTQQRVEDWYQGNNPVSFLFYFITILPLFFIGAGAAKMRLYEEVESNRKKMAYTALVFFFLGLVLKALPYFLNRNVLTDYTQDIFGGALLAAAYALFIAIVSEYRLLDRILTPLEAAGRLSISNYLFQSFVSTMIFYSYGLGYYGDISIFAGTLLALVIYCFQLAVSSWWVTKFYYGPVEWLWRSGTYMKLQPFRKGADL